MDQYNTGRDAPATPAPSPLPAGSIQAATEALAERQTFTREQVAHLLHLAYLSGGDARTRLDAAEMEAIFEEHPMPETTHKDRVARRLADMEEAAARIRHGYPPRRFWPAAMPGGWPLPPSVPSDDPADWWPEDDGWPVPPPALRGLADQ